MRRFTRLAAGVAATTLAVTGVALMTSPAHAAPDPAAKQAAASWIEDELQSGLMPDGFGGTDFGLTVDTAFALQAVGGHSSTVTSIADAIQSGGTSYLEPSYVFNGSYEGKSAGATAKVMAFFQNLSPARTTVGSINLQARMESLTTSSGRIADQWTKDGNPDSQDFSTTLGQAFAARGLSKVGSGEADEARAFLLQQQCAAGFFRLSFSATDATCRSGDTPNIDATAISIIQMAAFPSPPTAAIAKAKSWLAGVQNCDGSFGSGDDGHNANSTGLASTALAGSVAAKQAAIWLNARQASSGDGSLASEVGAVALNDADFASGKASGIAAGDRYRWRRATAQAAPGLADYSSTDVHPAIHLPAVAGYRHAGTALPLRVTGAEAGTVICSGTSRAIATSSGALVSPILPAGTATRVVTARDGYGDTASSSVKVLGAKDLGIQRGHFRHKRGSKITVTLSGLANNEVASIYYKGTRKAVGHANSAGRFAATFRVGRQKGRQVIRGFGQFGDIRNGVARIKVVR